VTPSSDPYATLGVSPGATDTEVRAAYRRLVQLHHPDHNGDARRFEEVQEAYARIRELRTKGAGTPPPRRSEQPPSGPSRPGEQPPPPRVDLDPDAEARLAELERQLREAQAARERAARAAREAAMQADARERPSDEELGYVTTDDSFGKIFSDAISGLFSEARPVGERVIEEIDELASKLKGRKPPHQ
jgi:curved DNA-binding protein CbpA